MGESEPGELEENPHSVILFFMTSDQLLYLPVYFLFCFLFFPLVKQDVMFHLSSSLGFGSIKALTD